MRWWPFGRRRRRAAERVVMVRGQLYDAARTTDENVRHWQRARDLAADQAASPSVRRTLRVRARYEVANNSYARGLLLTLAVDTVGHGPTLQMLTSDPRANEQVEGSFAAWAREVRLAEKMRAMRVAKAQDGEVFAIFVTNPALRHPVKLDFRLVEADYVASPAPVAGMRAGWENPREYDGIRYDAAGNPVAYCVHRRRPWSGGEVDYEWVDASKVVHWYRIDRPGQRRGVSELAPALELFAQLRRYTRAVVSAAETAAALNVLLKTTVPPGEEPAEIEGASETGLGGLTMDIERNTAVFLPEGWDAVQLRSEQPTAAYPDFKREIIAEIARCLNVPVNVAAFDSSRHNYASGRLDHQIYMRTIAIERKDLERVFLDPLLEAWIREASLAVTVLPVGRWMEEGTPHQWYWPGLPEIDPRWLKAEMEMVLRGLETEAEFYAKRGLDWEDQMRQRAREEEARRRLGLPSLEMMRAGMMMVEDESDADTAAKG